MKINYVPGLALRFYPGLSRELYDAVDTYIASGCKIALFTGTAPTEPEMWNLSNFNNYVTANTDKLVYQETTQLQFSYDGFKHKRVIQRYPIDSTIITPLIAPIAQDQAAIDLGAIKTDNSLYALIYCPDKDTTLNTGGNDLVLMVPGVGSGSTDFCSLSKVNFEANESMYFRNLTISLFQGYQITDTLITEAQPDPENPGQNINVPVDSKKSVYLNKVWGQRLSEAYRDCFISRDAFKFKFDANNTVTLSSQATKVSSFGSSLNDAFVAVGVSTNYQWYPAIRKYDKVAGTWLNSLLHTEMDGKVYNGYLVNQSMINLLDEINAKALLGQFTPSATLITNGAYVYNANNRFHAVYDINGTPHTYVAGDMQNTFGHTAVNEPVKFNVVPGLLAKYVLMQAHASSNIKIAITQILIEQGIDEAMINSALNSIVPIDFDLTKYSSAYDKDQNVLTIQNGSPAKLKTRYKKTINNPTNEQMYIVLPRFLNRWAIENPRKTNIVSYTGDNDVDYGLFGSISSVSYPATQNVIDGEVVDSSTQRIRQQDYTAISIGLTGNGNTDLEYDLLDVIDYIDSFTAMIKIPNKF